jgi:hypothetical protein
MDRQGNSESPCDSWPGCEPLTRLQRAKELLHGLASGTAEAYESYRSLDQIWRFDNSSVQELQPLFSIPGIEPDGQLSITEDFRRQVQSSATVILASLQDCPFSAPLR